MLNNYISGGPIYSWNGIMPGRIYQQTWTHSAERNAYGISILGSYGTSGRVQTNTGKDGLLLTLKLAKLIH